MSSVVERWTRRTSTVGFRPARLRLSPRWWERLLTPRRWPVGGFRLMRAARVGPADLSVFTAWVIGFSAPRTVPSAWGGQVPPVTMPDRHCKLDDYVAGNGWHRPGDQAVLLDLGCGFPAAVNLLR